MSREIGIYIHIPFCRNKCYYCDFYSESICDTFKDSIVEKYINSVCREILENTDILSTHTITSIYFGGGTPSLIDAKYIKQIIDTLYMFDVSVAAENTIELNPIDCKIDKLKEYINMNINRISVGIQSTNLNTLKKIGRENKSLDIKTVYDNIRLAGFNNISFDTITGLPDETLKMFEDTINNILALGENIVHISAYSLEVHENTKLDFLIKNEFLKLPNEDLERDMKHMLDKKLEAKGLIRYEISNYAKVGFESKHNLMYWTCKEYLGFGTAAASFITNTRYTNISNIQKYIENIKAGVSARDSVEELDELGLIKEYIILHLRLKSGINKTDFKLTFLKNINDMFSTEIKKLTDQKLLIEDKDKIYLSNKGEDLANIVWQEFI